MGRRNNNAIRCPACRMHLGLCLCAELPRIETRTRVVVLLHRSEDRKTTNTGKIAARCLVNSEVRVRGHREESSQPLALPEGVRPLLLFPFEDAVDVSAFAGCSEPLALVVPDGTWRQASKARNRVPGLRDATCVTLPPGPASDYRLRISTSDERLCTLEAIARALEVLEGPSVRSELESVLARMVTRTLRSRGDFTPPACP